MVQHYSLPLIAIFTIMTGLFSCQNIPKCNNIDLQYYLKEQIKKDYIADQAFYYYCLYEGINYSMFRGHGFESLIENDLKIVYQDLKKASYNSMYYSKHDKYVQQAKRDINTSSISIKSIYTIGINKDLRECQCKAEIHGTNMKTQQIEYRVQKDRYKFLIDINYKND
ncbi:MAG: hypothetical protein N4A45_04335 [Flavobacteriales bacterium]|jgi:hypothetical protein|nr:hypothetical protein [Flavobacteriales bacterium]